jgi:hypothetical protein
MPGAIGSTLLHLVGTAAAKEPRMSFTEYLLVALTILIPLVIAVAVTLWTLEQARLRSKKNRKQAAAKSGHEQPPAAA